MEFEAGLRRADPDHSTDRGLTLTQILGVPGRRAARRESADRSIAVARTDADSALRAAQRRVAETFLDGLAADDALQIATDTAALSQDLQRVADKRYEVGDVGILDVHVAQLEVARAEMELARARAERARVAGRLARMLGLSEERILFDGSLRARSRPSLQDLLTVSRPAPTSASSRSG